MSFFATRDRACGFATRREGVGGRELVGYVSAGGHSCIARAFDLLGLGTEALRLVPLNDEFTMDLDALAELVAADEAAGRTPFVIVGTAGSVNVGAIDDLHGLADFAAAHGLWLHVDGAFGAPAVLSDVARPLLRGMERADSLAFDFHKWLVDRARLTCYILHLTSYRYTDTGWYTAHV